MDGYSTAVADVLTAKVAGGMTLRDACKASESGVGFHTVNKWRKTHPKFNEQIKAAANAARGVRAAQARAQKANLKRQVAAEMRKKEDDEAADLAKADGPVMPTPWGARLKMGGEKRARILEMMMGGLSLRCIGRAVGCSPATILLAVADDADFHADYEKAKKLRRMAMQERMYELAMDADPEAMENSAKRTAHKEMVGMMAATLKSYGAPGDGDGDTDQKAAENDHAKVLGMDARTMADLLSDEQLEAMRAVVNQARPASASPPPAPAPLAVAGGTATHDATP